MSDQIINYINKTPKAELHLHIEGSLEPELMFKLSKRNKVEIPFRSVEEIKSAYNLSLIHISEPRDRSVSRMPSSA